MPQTAVRVFRGAGQSVPVLVWLAEVETRDPKAFAKCLALIKLQSELGYEMRRPHADMLRDGIYELRARAGTVNYRVLYFFCGRNAVCLSQGLTKEDVVPDAE